MLRVMSKKPVRPRLHRREQHRHIGGMANQPPIRHHRLQLRIRNHLRLRQLNQPTIVFHQIVGCPIQAFCWLEWEEMMRMDQQILFHLFANRLRQHQPADPCRTKRKHRLVQSPGSDYAPVSTFESRNSRSLRVTSSGATPKPPSSSPRHSGAQTTAPASAEASPKRRRQSHPQPLESN